MIKIVRPKLSFPSKRMIGIFVSIPWLLIEEIVPEKYREQWKPRKENTQDPAVSKESIKNILQMLNLDITSPLFSPFKASNPHKGLPPTYVQVGGLDPLRDGGLIYQRAKREWCSNKAR
ncbi:hypothetical protein BDW59DRAFT_146839 [Aspergillus cavernicola]|uniref:Alpha/beta hydrolase fold-3 domain-containing protein n=1 Tax=Aspergillus cavernicola TaxID=176166 RepID=A0ABR4IAU9_9EURO